MKPKPLKNKNKSFEGENNNALAFSYNDIESATEWFRNELFKIMNKTHNDGIKVPLIPQQIQQKINKKLNKAFEDVIDKGK